MLSPRTIVGFRSPMAGKLSLSSSSSTVPFREASFLPLGNVCPILRGCPKMASRVPVKHDRDQTPLDLQGFLNDLQEWELSTKSTDKKKLKHKPPLASSPQKMGDDRISTARVATSGSTESSSRPYPKNFSGIPATSRSFMNVDDDSTVDATSEKELGNEYFKQKKFNEAIDCYSRSIALSPTAVAYANRAMAYLKIKRYREAEEDCTEALNLDDHYIKAYSRRATARKELGKLKESVQDSEFAVKLEPDNQETKKQYTDLKSLYQKDVLNKASAALKSSAKRAEKGGISEAKVTGHDSGTNRAANTVDNKGKLSVQKSVSVMELENSNVKAGAAAEGQEANSRLASQRNQKPGKQELETSVLELASRAASRAMKNAAKDVKPPKSAYEFEVSWRDFSGDLGLERQLLKVTSPSALPQIFKNSLSAPMLLNIIKCTATFFTDDMDLAVKYLQNLTEVPRFNILLMCLSTADKAELLQLWDEVFCNEATPIEYAEILDNLRSKYCLK